MGLWGEDYWSHHIRPSRPTGCLRHGNVQFVPCCPIRLVPEQSDPIRWKNFSPSWQKHALCNHWSIIRDLRVSHFCLFFFLFLPRTQLDSLCGRRIFSVCCFTRLRYNIQFPGWAGTLFATAGQMFVIWNKELWGKYRVWQHRLQSNVRQWTNKSNLI